jgi:hypothetical protein
MSKGLLDDSMIRNWKQVCDQSEKARVEGAFEPCCNEENPCACATYSPYMARPIDANFHQFVDHPIRLTEQKVDTNKVKEIMKKLSKVFKKSKQ